MRACKKIRFVIECYDKGIGYREVRELLIKDFKKNLDWFQAPCNVAFVVIGLLYGEGDFKKSMIYAINCGDDTDCTGATIGAVLGIIYGKKGIPEDWASYLGDNLVTVAIDRTSVGNQLPRTCTELTERILDMIPVMFKANGIKMEFTDGESDISDPGAKAVLCGIENRLFSRMPYSYDGPDCVAFDSIVEFFEKPQIVSGESLKVQIRFYNKLYDQRHLHVKLHLPESWSCSAYKHDIHMVQSRYQEVPEGHAWEVEITAGERVEAMNRAILEVTSPGRPTNVMIPIIIAG